MGTDNEIRFRPSSDFDPANILMKGACDNFRLLSRPIPWIEPSINMPYLEAIRSFVFTNYLASIVMMGVTLEHTLKMAMLDPKNFGKGRELSAADHEDIGKDGKYSGVYRITNDRKNEHRLLYLLDGKENLKWWTDVSRALRNDAAHLNIIELLETYNNEEWQSEYASPRIDPYSGANWGFIWHRFAGKVAEKFIPEASEQIDRLINNTEWGSDESWYISQKNEYDRFFAYDWSIANVADSVDRIR